MTTETALPGAEQAEASGADEAPDAIDVVNAEGTQAEQADGNGDDKPQLSEVERERRRAERKIGRLVRQREELRAQLEENRLRQPAISGNNQQQQDDSETLTLTHAELQRRIADEAQRLAPQMQEQRAVIERRRAVIDGLNTSLGTERFDALAADLDDALGGLVDSRSKAPKPAADAIFEADDPAALIEYLADPDNSLEAEAIGKMTAVQAGRAIGRLESKIAAKKADSKPRPSRAASPIEAVRGSGTAAARDYNALSDDTAWYEARRKARTART